MTLNALRKKDVFFFKIVFLRQSYCQTMEVKQYYGPSCKNKQKMLKAGTTLQFTHMVIDLE